MAQNCIKYSDQIECIQCRNGFVLKKNALGVYPTYICSVIDPNCLKFNEKTNMCDQCSEGTVLEGRLCVFPLYGVDPNCVLYVNKLCEKCKKGWNKVGFICSKQ